MVLKTVAGLALSIVMCLGDGKPPEPVWTSDKPGPQEPSLLYYRGSLYALMDNGVLTCLDGQTGKEHYRQRLGGNCNSSPIASDGHVFVSNNDGTTFFFKPDHNLNCCQKTSLARESPPHQQFQAMI